MSGTLEYVAELSTLDPDRLKQVFNYLASQGTEVLPLLIESYGKNSDSGTRINILRAIGLVAFESDYYDPELIKKVLSILDEICSVRMDPKKRNHMIATAVKVAGMIGDVDTSKRLLSFFSHNDSRVRANAVEGLAFILKRWSTQGCEGSKEALEKAVKDNDVRVSVTATVALYLLHSVAAVSLKKRIDTLCHSGNEEIKNAAVTAAASFEIRSENFFDLFTPDSIFALLRFRKSCGNQY